MPLNSHARGRSSQTRRQLLAYALCAVIIATFTTALATGVAAARPGLCTGVTAGTRESNGYYTDGQIVFVANISCRRALALIRPVYGAIRRAQDAGLAHHRKFRIGYYRCGFSSAGPQILKTCSDGRRFFSFL